MRKNGNFVVWQIHLSDIRCRCTSDSTSRFCHPTILLGIPIRIPEYSVVSLSLLYKAHKRSRRRQHSTQSDFYTSVYCCTLLPHKRHSSLVYSRNCRSSYFYVCKRLPVRLHLWIYFLQILNSLQKNYMIFLPIIIYLKRVLSLPKKTLLIIRGLCSYSVLSYPTKLFL